MKQPPRIFRYGTAWLAAISLLLVAPEARGSLSPKEPCFHGHALAVGVPLLHEPQNPRRHTNIEHLENLRLYIEILERRERLERLLEDLDRDIDGPRQSR